MTNQQQELMERIHDINFRLLSELDRLCRKYGITYYLAYGGLLGVVRHKDFIPWDNDVDVVMTRAEFARLEPHLDELGDDFEYVRPSDYKEKYFDTVPRINYVRSAFHMFPQKDSFYGFRNNKIALDIFFIDRVRTGCRGAFFRFRLMLLYGMANAHRYRLEPELYKGIYKAAAAVLWAAGKLIPAAAMRRQIARAADCFNKDEAAPGYAVTNDTMSSLSRYYPREIFDGVTELEIRGRKFMAPRQPEHYLEIEYGSYMELPPEESRIPHFGPYPLDFDKIELN